MKSVRKWRMKWIRVGHILRRKTAFPSDAKALRGRINPFIILQDAPQHDTIDELVELARDKEEWQGTANAIYPAKHKTIDYSSLE